MPWHHARNAKPRIPHKCGYRKCPRCEFGRAELDVEGFLYCPTCQYTGHYFLGRRKEGKKKDLRKKSTIIVERIE